MQAESAALVENKGDSSKDTLKHLASLLAEEKMATMSSDEMKEIMAFRRRATFREADQRKMNEELNRRRAQGLAVPELRKEE